MWKYEWFLAWGLKWLKIKQKQTPTSIECTNLLTIKSPSFHSPAHKSIIHHYYLLAMRSIFDIQCSYDSFHSILALSRYFDCFYHCSPPTGVTFKILRRITIWVPWTQTDIEIWYNLWAAFLAFCSIIFDLTHIFFWNNKISWNSNNFIYWIGFAHFVVTVAASTFEFDIQWNEYISSILMLFSICISGIVTGYWTKGSFVTQMHTHKVKIRGGKKSEFATDNKNWKEKNLELLLSFPWEFFWHINIIIILSLLLLLCFSIEFSIAFDRYVLRIRL